MGDEAAELEAALAALERDRGPDHPDLVAPLERLGVLRHNEGRYREAETLYRRALAIAEKANHPGLAAHLNNLGLVCRDQGRHGEAEPYFERARRMEKGS